MSTFQDFWNEALAAGIDGKIKLQAAELQELEDVRKKARMKECEQLGEKSVCHEEEEAVEQGIEDQHRDKAVEQDI